MAISQTAIIRDLLARLEPRIRDAFLEAINRDYIDRAALIEALARGDIERAAQIVRLNQQILFPLQDAIRGAFITGGQSVTLALPKAVSGQFGFDGRAWRAEQWVQREGAALVQGIEAESLDMARKVIRQGLEDGYSPPTVARQITGRMVGGKRVGGFLGLTSQQTDSIIAGRAKLLSGDPTRMAEYLGLKLRDKRNDALIRKAMAGKVKLSVADVDRIIEGHKAKALKYRGEVIAKNEAFQAQAAGRHEGYRQMLDSGKVEAVTKKWQHATLKEPRLDHLALDGTVLDFDAGFVMADGAVLQFPHDPAGGARHSIGCRCTAVYRVKVARD